jgi:putative transcriptional regulator
MTIRHHPRDETLLELAAGSLPPGPALVIRSHLEACEECRRRIAELEVVGGALLEALPPTSLAPESLAEALAAIDREDAPRLPLRPRSAATPPDGDLVLPAALQDCTVGNWRFLGPGMRWSRVALPEAPEANLMLLRIGPGRRLPEHGHVGTEYTQVLRGSFSDWRGCYRAGDLMEADSEIDHHSVVETEGECICLVALEGQLRLRGWVGRLFGPLLGF